MSGGRTYSWPSRFGPEDRDQLRALLNAIVATSGTNGYSSPLTREDVDKLADSLEHQIDHDMAAQLIVRDAKRRIVGICTMERPPQPDRRHVLDVKRVALAPDVRGGIFLIEGLAHVLDRSEAMGAELLAIDVSEDGPHGLWARLGFETFGTMQDYARVGERRLAGYYMSATIRVIREHLERFGHA
jgi:hypothetical protein